MSKLIIRKEFGEQLMQWWAKNQRKFPWRNTKNPYHILISEILLQRTNADQVVAVYQKLLRRYPSIGDLAQAYQSDLKTLLHSLGLEWRSRHLKHMAQDIVKQYRGKIPTEKMALESLPGMNHYIASAVRSFAFRHLDVLLDKNTVRILGRILGVTVNATSGRTKRFVDVFRLLVDQQHPRQFHYALTDLAALLCKPCEPLCGQCPVRHMCEYGSCNGKK